MADGRCSEERHLAARLVGTAVIDHVGRVVLDQEDHLVLLRW
ncbi:hypothetical protein [Amycolatopsis sp. GA6-003]